MRDHARSMEPAVVGRGDTFLLSDADFVAPASPDTPAAGVMPQDSYKAKSVSVAMLLLGIALLWPVPLGGALLLCAAGAGLTLFREAQPDGPTTNATSR